jgi:glucosylceramidase
MWTFTPTNICDGAANPSCGFCGNVTTGKCAPKNAIDGNASTRYTSGQTQVGTENFVLSFAAPVSVTGIKLDSSGSATDATTSYLVEYSLDGTTFQGWCPPVSGPGAGAITDITFPARISVKALKVSQTGQSADGHSWWSIHEVTLDGCQ